MTEALPNSWRPSGSARSSDLDAEDFLPRVDEIEILGIRASGAFSSTVPFVVCI
jgi:hypothetical protein